MVTHIIVLEYGHDIPVLEYGRPYHCILEYGHDIPILGYCHPYPCI